jgi:putative nucleotidyltransferase with HDIG domain
MKDTHQNPVFHGEDDVYTHTQMVCRRLTETPAFYKLPDMQRTELFLAAVLHDIGKVKTTRLEDGSWVSPHHASAGSRIVRKYLWETAGLCGTLEMFIFRETVCALIHHHMLPVYLMDREDSQKKTREVAAIGEMAPDFSWKLLCMLTEADVKGRIAGDIPEGLAKTAMAEMMAEEAGCLYEPYPFAGEFTKRAYLSGRNVQPDQVLYDDSWGEVIMLSGLPGTGKDTWIHRNYPQLPAVSLDHIRNELKIKPTDNQGKVIQAAQERAREYLRKKQPFIWNATDLTKDTRQTQISLFERYGARVRLVYLETGRETRAERNIGRTAEVPEEAVSRMLGKLVPPTPDEAHTVEWLFI